MAGLVPAIHVLLCLSAAKTWMPGTRPGMTNSAGRPILLTAFFMLLGILDRPVEPGDDRKPARRAAFALKAPRAALTDSGAKPRWNRIAGPRLTDRAKAS
jgi:hypothetical protein